jgi:hypothetical protein
MSERSERTNETGFSARSADVAIRTPPKAAA